MWSRGLRCFYLRHFDSDTRRPGMAGRIVCHILDFDGSRSLAAQLSYLAARGVRTFRIYSNRPADVEAILASHQAASGLSACVIPATEPKQRRQVWKKIDNFNFGLPVDRWSLLLKAGELLLYPHFERRSLTDLCQFLFDEGRRSFFAIVLDAYPARAGDDPPFAPGAEGWAIDHFGYAFEFNELMQVDRWHGGFLYRYPDLLGRYGRPHIARTPMIRAGYRTYHTRDLTLALPRRLNLANSPHHLSPTGCIISDNAYEFWLARIDRNRRDEELRKLTSAPQLAFGWRHDELAEKGFMNLGQWL
jgi:hypothetical protein